MIIWGSGGKVVDLGLTGYEHCEVCEKTRPFHVYLKYRYAHLYYIFSWVTKRQYVKACEVCGRGSELQKADVPALLPQLPASDPIPFMNRYGWLIGLSILGALLLFGVFAGG
ncbi:MAG TPA: hypothetical protein VGE98_02700 [Thermoanaerobaculia bacterium]